MRPILPSAHARFLERALAVLEADPRIFGVAAGGSYLSGRMDEWSDLDLLLGVEDAAHAEVMRDRPAIAGALGPLLNAFGAEHVGEPRMLICLYGPPLLHVDLKFLRAAEFATRVERPAILLDRGGRLAAALDGGEERYPTPEPQWLEDRVWTWVHYGATKIGRGELFEAQDTLSWLRTQVLGPLALLEAGARPAGVRRLELHHPEFARAMERTLSGHGALDYLRALRAAADLYRELRGRCAGALVRRTVAEEAVEAFLDDLETRLRSAGPR